MQCCLMWIPSKDSNYMSYSYRAKKTYKSIRVSEWDGDKPLKMKYTLNQLWSEKEKCNEPIAKMYLCNQFTRLLCEFVFKWVCIVQKNSNECCKYVHLASGQELLSWAHNKSGGGAAAVVNGARNKLNVKLQEM